MSVRDRVDVPDLVLERYRLGELPPTASEAVARREREDDLVRRRLEALTASDADLRRLVPSKDLAQAVRARLASKADRGTRPGLRAFTLAAAMAAVAAVALFTPWLRDPAPASLEPGVRIKGLKPGLALFRKTGDHSESLADGDVARAGDLIRVGYRAAGRRFGAILSVDGRGHVTLHLPTRGRQAAPLQPGEVVLLDHAFELDDAPRGERFFFVTSDTPFGVEPIVEDARHAGAGGTLPAALTLPPPLEQSVFSLEKGMGP
jgi:hypothetical protein